ncbi:hypothetical protein ACQEV4_22470 [Streptomyces shenzhenensis]|uniref:hypothetical protein n=1 Tax=Streptomyces shenzhenensis TaxID=943815 RepID=UPI003D8A7F9F
MNTLAPRPVPAAGPNPPDPLPAAELPVAARLLKAGPRVTENAGVRRRQEDRSLDGTEPVGSRRFPRPPEWPVMPVTRARLRLEPDGFSDGGHGCG